MTTDPQTLDFTAAQRPQVHRTVMREITPWRAAEGSGLNEAGQPLVEACMVEIDDMDAYEVVMATTAAIKHRFWDTKKKKQDTDLSVDPISPDKFLDQVQDGQVIHKGQKTRFKTVIADYEAYLKRGGRDYPIILLADKVYPDVIFTLKARGILTAQAFAEMSAEDLEAVREQLRRDKQEFMAMRLGEFHKRAIERLAEQGYELKKAKPAKTAA